MNRLSFTLINALGHAFCRAGNIKIGFRLYDLADRLYPVQN